MAIYELTESALSPLTEPTFSVEELRERGDWQRLLRDRVEIVAPDTMVLAEEFGSCGRTAAVGLTCSLWIVPVRWSWSS